MDTEKQTTLIAQLQSYKDSGKNFYESKQLLLKAGYSKHEISLATASVSFGVAQDTGDDTSKGATTYYEDQAALELLDNLRDRQVIRHGGLTGYALVKLGVIKYLLPIGLLGIFVLAVVYGVHTTTGIIDQQDIIQIMMAYLLGALIYIIVKYLVDALFSKLITYKIELGGKKPTGWWVLAKVLEVLITLGLTAISYFVIIRSFI